MSHFNQGLMKCIFRTMVGVWSWIILLSCHWFSLVEPNLNNQVFIYLFIYKKIWTIKAIGYVAVYFKHCFNKHEEINYKKEQYIDKIVKSSF